LIFHWLPQRLCVRELNKRSGNLVPSPPTAFAKRTPWTNFGGMARLERSGSPTTSNDPLLPRY
jgi:hypothetical protein